MFVLHVAVVVKKDHADAAADVFSSIFRPAICAQKGFRHVEFLRNASNGEYILSIGFENEMFQKKWVATELHQEVWPQMEEHFERYGLTTFVSV